MDLLKPDLYGAPAAPGRDMTLRGGRCTCGHVFFPMQTYGCEKCGRTGASLAPAELPGTGTLVASARVLMHMRKDRTPPFVVVSVRLDAGPVVRTLLAGDRADRLPIGTRMRACAAEVGRADDGTPVLDLRFSPADGSGAPQ